jgi:DNA-binding IclR family transcriptional regulator
MAGSKKVNSISRAASILRCIANGTGRITHIASQTKLSSSTVHRLIKTLQVEGFVEQDPLTLKYTLGPLLITLTLNPLVTHASLVSCAMNEMERLRDLSGETIGLVIRLGLQRLQLEELPSDRVLKYSVGKGFVEPVYLAASGKVLLAQIPFEDRDKLLKIIEKNGLLEKKGFKTTDLLKEVRQAEKNGYAVSFEEIVPGASSIAVPVEGYVVPVAMCIFGPMERFDLKSMKKVLPALKKASRSITRNVEEYIPKRVYP